ncbi:GNAT family N-acetyltransferase [Acuticoccus sp. I52.16.1]|uniref:GNAT family N-acetyltransferase n=1 Tax=Acuticoccus sp. I52.16.1 TaxID=2928472 RepID=UPI001FD32D4A|nr:GNAT family protein [Acuticoccus sp. I52.16.1]UOM33269.1 GNAT family N-acetyltransferase [Acuticoccus sp. I52.16.1]
MTTKPTIAPVTLRDSHVTLAPLAHAHHDGLVEAAEDGDVWRLWYTAVPSRDGMTAEIDRRLGLQEAGTMVPFTVFDGEGRIAGMTTYMNVDRANQRVEIGSTWYAQRVQRTRLNTQAKRLLLGHAFEALDCIAVEFRTHFMNRASRKAIERLGAKLDGVLRNHQIAPDGSLRDTVVYSILPHEWPAVRNSLTGMLERMPA